MFLLIEIYNEDLLNLLADDHSATSRPDACVREGPLETEGPSTSSLFMRFPHTREREGQKRERERRETRDESRGGRGEIDKGEEHGSPTPIGVRDLQARFGNIPSFDQGRKLGIANSILIRSGPRLAG